MQILVTGILLGGTYALIALGLTLQYGAARIMNLANGETLVASCFVAFWLFTVMGVNPLLGIVVIAPAALVLNWLIYARLCGPSYAARRTGACSRPIRSSPLSACCFCSRA